MNRNGGCLVGDGQQRLGEPELPLFAQVVLSLDGSCSAETQARPVNQLSRADVDGYSLLIDQLVAESPAGLLVAAIRLALVLQQSGRPVVLSR